MVIKGYNAPETKTAAERARLLTLELINQVFEKTIET
jgi:hypothetical protein